MITLREEWEDDEADAVADAVAAAEKAHEDTLAAHEDTLAAHLKLVDGLMTALKDEREALKADPGSTAADAAKEERVSALSALLSSPLCRRALARLPASPYSASSASSSSSDDESGRGAGGGTPSRCYADAAGVGTPTAKAGGPAPATSDASPMFDDSRSVLPQHPHQSAAQAFGVLFGLGGFRGQHLQLAPTTPRHIRKMAQRRQQLSDSDSDEAESPAGAHISPLPTTPFHISSMAQRGKQLSDSDSDGTGTESPAGAHLSPLPTTPCHTQQGCTESSVGGRNRPVASFEAGSTPPDTSEAKVGRVCTSTKKVSRASRRGLGLAKRNSGGSIKIVLDKDF